MSDVAVPTSGQLFAELRSRVAAAGLLKKDPWGFCIRYGTVTFLWLAGLGALFFIENVWFLLLDAVFLATVYSQAGFGMHDAGHRQAFKRTWLNNFVGCVVCAINGMSLRYWMDIHNAHHDHPNQDGADPDMDIPVVAFSKEQAERRSKGMRRILIHNQAWFFFIFITITSFNMRQHSLMWVFRNKKDTWFLIDILTFSTWLLTNIILPFVLFGFGLGLLFILVNQLLLGFFLGMAFAPNHKGMPVLQDGHGMDFLHQQILTARNVKGNFLLDFFYGGLNLQIEHHLFPTMPQFKLRRARKIVKGFCEEKGIKYYETGLWTSCKEIAQHMHHIAQFA